jgi:hypothetical protein
MALQFLGSLVDMCIGAAIMWAMQTFVWPWLKPWVHRFTTPTVPVPTVP